MNRQFFRVIAAGLLLGVALYFLPFFLLKIAAFFLIFGLFFRLFGWRRHYRGGRGWAMADRLRSMSDEDYEEFKSRGWRHCGNFENDEQKSQES